MPRNEKIPGVPNLFRNAHGKYVFRKYIKGKGEMYETLQAQTLYEAKVEINRILSRWLGSLAPRDFTTVEVIGDECIKLYESNPTETYKNYERHWRLHLKPYFQGFLLDEVGAGWRRYVAYQKQLNPDRKLRHDRMVMSVILHYAKSQDRLATVPDLQIPEGDRSPVPGREYSNQEIKNMLAHAPKNLSLHLEMQVKMGMRSGECDKLKWEYIDFEAGLIRLPPQIVKNRYGRIYPVDPDVLKKLFDRQDNKSPYVFPNRRDPMKPKTRSDRQWQKLKVELGLRGKRHWLRHTAVTRFIRAGIPPTMVQKALGMSDQVMKRVYLHSNEKDARKLATLVAQSLGNSELNTEHSE